jgi:hypothetical protein
MDSRPVRRLTITLDESYADFRRRFEATVPVLDSQLLANLVKRNAGWDEVITYANAAAPLDFFLFWSLDVGPTMPLNGNTSSCCEYLMGNYVIAQTCLSLQPAGDALRALANCAVSKRRPSGNVCCRAT